MQTLRPASIYLLRDVLVCSIAECFYKLCCIHKNTKKWDKCLWHDENKCYLTNWQQFFMVCTLFNHRNDVQMFKTHVKPLATGKWFQCSVCVYNNIDNIIKFLGKLHTQEKEKQIVPPSRHFHFLSTIVLDLTSFPGSLSYLWERSLETRLLLTNQRRWNCLVIVKKHLSPHENLLPQILRVKYRSQWKVLFK